MKRFEKYTKWIVAFLLGVALIAVYKTFDNFGAVLEWFLNVLRVIRPFIVGFFIAYVLHLPCKKLERLCGRAKFSPIKNHAKGISVLAIYVIAVLILTVLMRMIIPAIYTNVVDFYYNLPEYISLALQFIHDKLGINLLEFDNETVNRAVQGFLSKIDLNQFGKYAQGVINVTSGVVSTFIALIVSVYALMDSERITAAVKRVMRLFVPDERCRQITDYVLKTNNIFSTYIYCQLLDAAIVAVAATIVLSILQVRYAIVLGFLIGFCNLIPYFGAIIGVTMTILLTLFTGGFFKCLWTGISLLVLQQIDANFIGPKIMGNMLKLRPLWIIFAVTVGGGLFGVLGMLLSVPVLVVLKMIIGDYLKTVESRRSIQQEEE